MKFDWLPDLGAKKVVEPNVKVTKFGDGYEARIPTSINSSARKWECTFTKNLDEANQIDAFFAERNATKNFQWTDPQGYTGVFVCRTWSMNQSNKGIFAVSATMEEVFEELSS